MTLWSFLVVLSGASALGAAMSVSHNYPRHIFWAGMVIGLAVGSVCAWIIQYFGRRIGNRIAKATNMKHKDVAYRNLYITAFIWIIISGIIAFYIVRVSVGIIAAR